MRLFTDRLSRLHPFYETPGDGGGGGGQADSGGGTTNTGDAGGGTTTAPTVYDVSDDTLIRVKGQQNPVKYGESIRGLQGQFTKASQRAAQLQKQYDDLNARYQQEQQQRQQAPQQGGQPDMYAQLEALPYLNGKEAAQVVRNIGQQFQQRDMVLMAALKQLQQTQTLVNNLNQTHSMQSFDSKINGWVTQGGYPQEAVEFAKVLYLAHEGDDLDQEFPSILANYWAKFGKTYDAQKAAKVQQARKSPFIPGTGGNTAPSKPLDIKANLGSKQLGAQLWDLLPHADEQ